MVDFTRSAFLPKTGQAATETTAPESMTSTAMRVGKQIGQKRTLAAVKMLISI